jgi:hypothetical protein
MNKWNGLLAAVVVGFLSFPAGAQAQVPDECQDSVSQRAYNAGALTGASLTRQAWNAVNDCDRVEDFETIILNTLDKYDLPQNAPNYLICRYSGLVQGILDTLDILYQNCVEQCEAEGEIAGDVSAIAYCELSIALGGLTSADAFIRGPVQVCGLSFEVGCDSMFNATSLVYANAMGTCLPYTEDPFDVVWDQARYYQCAYNPIPPPPTDDQ